MPASTRILPASPLTIVRLLCAVLALTVLPAYAQAQVIYSITDLGTLGGPSSGAQGINASGQVTGFSTFTIATGPSHAFRTSPGGRISDPGTDLGTLGGGTTS